MTLSTATDAGKQTQHLINGKEEYVSAQGTFAHLDVAPCLDFPSAASSDTERVDE